MVQRLGTRAEGFKKTNKHKKNKNSKNLAVSCQVSFIVQAVTGSVFHSDCFCFFILLLYKTNTTSYLKLICKVFQNATMIKWSQMSRHCGGSTLLFSSEILFSPPQSVMTWSKQFVEWTEPLNIILNTYFVKLTCIWENYKLTFSNYDFFTMTSTAAGCITKLILSIFLDISIKFQILILWEP